MSALRKEDRTVTAQDVDSGTKVFKARPQQAKPDYRDMRQRAKTRFSKTVAYLAK